LTEIWSKYGFSDSLPLFFQLRMSWCDPLPPAEGLLPSPQRPSALTRMVESSDEQLINSLFLPPCLKWYGNWYRGVFKSITASFRNIIHTFSNWSELFENFKHVKHFQVLSTSRCLIVINCVRQFFRVRLAEFKLFLNGFMKIFNSICTTFSKSQGLRWSHIKMTRKYFLVLAFYIH